MYDGGILHILSIINWDFVYRLIFESRIKRFGSLLCSLRQVKDTLSEGLASPS